MTKTKVTKIQVAEETLNNLCIFLREVQADSGRILAYVLPALLGAFVINIPRFFDVLKVNVCEDYTHCGCSIVYRWDAKTIPLERIV